VGHSERHGFARHGFARHGFARHGFARHGFARHLPVLVPLTKIDPSSTHLNRAIPNLPFFPQEGAPLSERSLENGGSRRSCALTARLLSERGVFEPGPHNRANRGHGYVSVIFLSRIFLSTKANKTRMTTQDALHAQFFIGQQRDAVSGIPPQGDTPPGGTARIRCKLPHARMGILVSAGQWYSVFSDADRLAECRPGKIAILARRIGWL
jgi:hypothetical protein